MASERIGKYIDKFEIIEEVGRGGMGAVYKALHPQFKKYVAIKEIKSDLANNPEFQRRFELEVEILAQLPSHPNIVTVRDALVCRGQLFLVMDYIEGCALSDLVMGDGVDAQRGAELLSQILSGLEAIHRCAIVHRDLKPGNILIDGEGIPYISDFGIAQSAGMSPPEETMGTAKYAAPELLDPELSRGGTEQQIDVYAMGMVAYEMLLGENRFRAEFSEVYNTTGQQRPERWLRWHTDLASAARNLNDIDPTIPRPLANVVQRMMAKDLNARYCNAGDARRDLAAGLPEMQDTRGRRSGPPPEDATVPLDQLRGGGARPVQPTPPRQIVRTRRVQPIEGAGRQRPSEEAASEVSSPAPELPRSGGRSVPRWVWWTSGAGALVVVGAMILVQLLFASPGFILIVKGAPVGSDIYVDNKRVGIPASDGTIRVFGLDATPGRRSVRVSCEGCEDYQGLVTGRDGDKVDFAVSMSCNGGQQDEIEYNGPMILVREGEFEMGDDTHDPNERPKHKVSVPAYYIDKFEVTNRLYKKFCMEKTSPPPPNPFWDDNYFENSPDFPVIGVSWEDARKYAEWAGKDLPTEIQWEKAASWDPKKNEKRQYPWGNSAEPARANIGSGKPGAVGRYAGDVSAYGVRDMAGNASEWVADDYNPYPGNAVQNQHYSEGNKAVRGTNFGQGTLAYARTASRLYRAPAFSAQELGQGSYVIGFRCAVKADDPRLMEYLRKKKAGQ